MAPDAPGAVTVSAMPSSNPESFGQTATRRMCAGTYLDRHFRDQILHEVYNKRNRRIAPSYGFDVVPVVTHAWRAWRLETYQHLAILLLLVIAAVRFLLATIIVTFLIIVWYMARAVFHWGRDLAAYFRERKSISEYEQIRSRGKVLGYGLLCLAILLVVAVIFTVAHKAQLAESWPTRTGLAYAFIGLAFADLVLMIATAMRQRSLDYLGQDNASRSHWSSPRIATLQAQQAHPFTVYSTFMPFVGAGTNIVTWSFAQRLVHVNHAGIGSDQEYDEPPFTTKQLVSRLKTSIESLRQDENPETRLPGLTVDDHVFLEGTHSVPYRPILGNNPVQKDISADIDKVMEEPCDVARHYLACRVVSWEGEVVTNVFVHVSLQGRTLYIELTTYALTPTRRQYHIIDEVGGTGPGAMTRSVAKSLVGLPDALLAVRFLVQVPSQLWAALQAQRDGTLTVRRGVNIGADFSAREAAIAPDEESYFQFRDILKHWKIIERRLIATVGDFLKECDVDTSEFWERATSILNKGVINMGAGNITITGSAIGDQASVNNAPATPGG